MGWIKRLFRRAKLEREMTEELGYHMDHRVAELTAEGVDVREARRLARLEFGGEEQIKEACRDARGTRWVEDFIQDCRYGQRMLRQNPVFTIVAIFSLALGIGANTAIFSLMDRLIFRMMPVSEPEQLVQIERFHPPYGAVNLSYPLLQSLERGVGSFEGLFAHHMIGIRDITIDADAEPAEFDVVSGSYFPLLGVSAFAGNTFGREVDSAPGANPVAVISHPYWERRFASNPAVVGKTFRRLNTVFTIIGVMPRGFFGTVVGRDPEIMVPLTMDAAVRGGKSYLNEPNYQWLAVMGRLKPGLTLNQAQAEVKSVFANIMASDVALESEQHKRARLNEYVELQPGGNGFDDLRRRYAEPLRILMYTAALVLLLACTNLANLLLTKSAARQHEIAVRLAVGAGRGRVVRQLLAEGLLLAFAGGAAGVWLAYVLASGLVTMMASGGSRLILDVRPEGRALLFAAAASMASCVLFSLVPALQATRPSFQKALVELRSARWRLGKGLVVAQMAISVLLLIGAGLFGRTLINMYTLDPGFDRHGVVLFSTNAARLGYSRNQIQQIQNRVPAELSRLPGIESASISMFAPISGGGWDGTFVVEGHTRAEKKDEVVHANSVGSDFFKTFRTPVVLGREFNERDHANSLRVAVVNEAFARYYFPDKSPVGRWVAFEGPESGTHYEIVGVVKDVKYESIRHEFPRTLYMMSAQVPPGPDSYVFSIRSNLGIAEVGRIVERALSGMDRALRPVGLIGMENHVERSLLRERMLAALGSFFGALALLLGAVGIYGVMAFQVARRRKEIGIRMALGADASSVIGMVLGQTIRLTLIGCAIGAAGGLVVSRAAEGVLYGVRPDDPVTFIGAILILLLVALMAAYVPGSRAALTNPIETLRVD